MTGYGQASIDLKIVFDNPLSVSFGAKSDVLTVEFVEPESFISKSTGKTLADNKVISQKIPKQFPSETAY